MPTAVMNPDAVAKRVRNAMIARVTELLTLAQAENDARHTPDGDVRVMTLGLLRRDLERVDVRGLVTPAPEE